MQAVLVLLLTLGALGLCFVTVQMAWIVCQDKYLDIGERIGLSMWACVMACCCALCVIQTAKVAASA